MPIDAMISIKLKVSHVLCHMDSLCQRNFLSHGLLVSETIPDFPICSADENLIPALRPEQKPALRTDGHFLKKA